MLVPDAGHSLEIFAEKGWRGRCLLWNILGTSWEKGRYTTNTAAAQNENKTQGLNVPDF